MGKFDHIDPGNAGGSVPVPEPEKFRPVPVTYPCADCDRVFDDIEALRVHRLDQHPIKRPYLYLANVSQHLSRYRVTRALQPGDLHFVHAESILVNGKPAPDQYAAAGIVCSSQTGRTELTLASSGYSVDYILDFDIIADSVALAVEKAFLQSRRNSNSNMDCLRLFNEQVQALDSSALGYAAALDRYLVGIMAKDRVAGCQIPYEEYPEKLGEALDRLSHIRRPTSEAVISLIRLVLNSFEDAPSDSEIPFLGATKAALREGKLTELGRDGMSAGGIPVDNVTEMVMLFATVGDEYRRENVSELKHLVGSNRLSELDHLKLHLLMLAWYGQTGDFQKLREHYARVRHVRQVAAYARTIYGKYEK